MEPTVWSGPSWGAIFGAVGAFTGLPGYKLRVHSLGATVLVHPMSSCHSTDWTGAFSLGTYCLGAHRARPPDFELSQHSMHWRPKCQAPGKPSTRFPGERPVECEATDISDFVNQFLKVEFRIISCYICLPEPF